jgi:CIC family chloride channel protein
MKTWPGSIFKRIHISQTAILGGISVIVGFVTGVGVWLFKQLIILIHSLLFNEIGPLFAHIGSWTVFILPAIGGAAVGLIAYFLIKEEKLHGTAGIIQAVALTGGRLNYERAPVKVVASAISIGAGASVGPEDPSVLIGSSLGSWLGQILRMSEDRVRTLVAAGAGAAIAAAFNAPIAGVFFALEIILGEIGGSSLGMILVAAVVSSLFTQAVSGTQPAFAIPDYAYRSAWELPLYLLLGLLAGPLSALYARLLYLMQDFARSIRLHRSLLAVLTGLVLGITGIFLPQVLGVGYDTIGVILNSTAFPFWLLLVLLVAKLLLTPASLAGGFYGGVFAPTLFLGATLGSAFGSVMAMIFPSLGIHPAAFALVGMAAVLAGSVHAPLTAVILLFEMTNDYRIILPLMFAVAVSLLISQRIQADSVYALGLARHGIRLDRGRDVEVLQAITVGEAMQETLTVLNENASLEKAADILAKSRHHGLPVVDNNKLLVGILTIADIEHARAREAEVVGDACTRNPEVAYPDEPLNQALHRMSQRDLGRLPVVTRENTHQLVGILRRADIIHAYDIALTRRTAQRHHEKTVLLDAFTPARIDVNDVIVEDGSQCAGKKLSEIPFPRDCVIASVRRGRQVFIPRGDTTLKAGDVLVVVAEGAARENVNTLCCCREKE